MDNKNNERKERRGNFIGKCLTITGAGATTVANHYLKFVESEQIVWGIAIILICLVLLKDTIWKCFNRWCEREEIIEKEITKREKLGAEKDKTANKAEDKTSDAVDDTEDAEIKYYKIRRKSS